jgi:hypothetical protein
VDYSIFQHGFSVSGYDITIKAGDEIMFGAVTSTTPQATFTLAGTQYFYVTYSRSGMSSAWAVAGAKPSTTTTTSIDVYCFKFYEGTLQNIGHLGDILFDLPLA